MRIAVAQGPLHAVVAGAAVAEAQRERPDENVLVIGGMETANEGGIVGATAACARTGPWADVVGVPEGSDPVERLGNPSDVSELVVIRNWQPLNEALLRAYPDARVTVYGDTFGIIDIDHSGPRVDRILTVVPQPERDGSIGGVPVEVLPRDVVVDAVAAAREALPELVAYDAELAEWARGGVLALIANLTEGGGTTLRGEIEQGYGLIRRLAAAGAPVVIKPHPRASLGQAAAIARRLRRDGYPVRVVPAEPFGVYPIELFESLSRAVDGIQSGQSTAVVSLLYLYGVAPDVDMPLGLGLRTQFPYVWRRGFSIAVHNRRVLDLLPRWDGKEVFPVPPQVFPGLPERVIGVPPGRLLSWNAEGAPGERRVSSGVPARGDAYDDALGIVWSVEHARGLLDGLPSEPAQRMMATLERLRERAAGAAVTLAAHVRPSANAPRWERMLSRDAPFTVAANARFTAEELEDLLEAHVDLTERRPELFERSLRGALARRRAAAPPLRAEFSGRLRG